MNNEREWKVGDIAIYQFNGGDEVRIKITMIYPNTLQGVWMESCGHYPTKKGKISSVFKSNCRIDETQEVIDILKSYD
jgi:hypothetical protein